MSFARGITLAAAVCAALMASGAADAAKSSKKMSKSMTAASAAPSVAGGNSSGMGGGPNMDRPPGHGAGFLLDRFDEIDTSKNGELSKAEITAWVEAKRAEMKADFEAKFKAADKDGDGALTKEEAQAAFPRMYDHFDIIDANKDGKVTTAELEALRDRDQLRQRIEAKFKETDKDGNGKLDLNEVTTGMPGLVDKFKLLDKNGDGYLSPDELRPQHGPGGPG